MKTKRKGLVHEKGGQGPRNEGTRVVVAAAAAGKTKDEMVDQAGIKMCFH